MFLLAFGALPAVETASTCSHIQFMADDRTKNLLKKIYLSIKKRKEQRKRRNARQWARNGSDDQGGRWFLQSKTVHCSGLRAYQAEVQLHRLHRMKSSLKAQGNNGLRGIFRVTGQLLTAGTAGATGYALRRRSIIFPLNPFFF